MPNQEKLLASRNGLGRVQQCACGTIHVSVGPVELKFTRKSFLQTFEMLCDAASQMDKQTNDSEPIEQIALDALRALQN
jgi:hypothetical protein